MIKPIILLILFLFTSVNIYAETYEEQIQNLQEQINQLNKKIEEEKIQNEKDNKELKTIKNLLNGIEIHGRIHVDGSWYNQNNQLKNYHINSYNDKFSIRRARLTIIKNIDDFTFRFEGNFDNDRAYLGETNLKYNISDDMALIIGQVIAPAFMEREKSSNTMSTIDFNSFTKMGWFSPYLIGLNYTWKTNKFGLSTGIFGNGTNIENKLENDMNYNFSFRSWYTPIRNENYVIHLGLDLMYQDYEIDQSNNPNQIKRNYFYGFELGFEYKYITWVNEYIKTYYQYDKDRFQGETFNFDGFSSELTINLTGEHKIYNKSGYFDGIKVKRPLSKGGFGAFQGVLRYSFANGKDRNTIYTDNIGSHYDYTFGINWIPEDYFMLLFNYSINGITAENYKYKGKYDAFKIQARMFF